MTMAELIHTPPSPRVPREEATTELIAAMREIIRYAIMTLSALRDPDARFLGMAQAPVEIVRDATEAYGYSSPRLRRFQPSPKHVAQMEIVMPWLAWLRRQKDGEIALRRLIGWSMGVQTWRLGMREECSEQTILNRMDRSVVAIIKQFASVTLPVEKIEEPFDGPKYSLVTDRLPGPHGGEVRVMKVYIGGDGFYRGGKPVRDGREKAERKKFT